VSHPEMGQMLIFLVATGQDEKGYQYEAVFNRFLGDWRSGAGAEKKSLMICYLRIENWDLQTTDFILGGFSISAYETYPSCLETTDVYVGGF